MAKYLHDDVLDAKGNYIKAAADREVACTTQPANYAAVAALTLASVAVASGDFTLADDTNGRKCTLAAKTGVAITATGSHGHTCLVDDTTSKLLAVTTANGQTLTSGNTADFPAWKINDTDPT